MVNLRHVAILFTLFLACGESKPPALAEIEDIHPEMLEPGDVLRITGNGFVEGPCHVTFKGTFEATGIRGKAFRSITVRGIAVSERLIELPMTSKIVKKLATEPLVFNGLISIDFPVKASAVRITAEKSSLTFSITPGGLGVATAAKRQRQADINLRALGVQLGDPRGENGLVVAKVLSGSAAEQAGITVDDRILAVDSQSLDTYAGFSLVNPHLPHKVEVINRLGIVRVTTIAPLLSGPLDRDELTAVILTCIALGMFLAFGAPRRGRDPKTMIISEDPFTQAVCVAAVSAPLTLVPAVSILALDGIPLLVALFACQGIAITLLIFVAAGKGVMSMAPRILIIPVVVGVTAFQSSGLGLNDIVESQHNGMFGPHALANPFSFFLTAAAVSLIWPGRRELLGQNENRRRLKSALRWIAATSAACIVTACLLGGWGIPFVKYEEMSLEPLHLLAGTLVFLVKTWLVLMTARWIAASTLTERRDKRLPRPTVFRAAALFASAVGTVYFHLSDLTNATRSAGHVVATALFVTIASALLMVSITSSISALRRVGKQPLHQSITTLPKT